MATAAFGHERPYDLLRDGVSTVVPAEVQGGEGAHQWQRVCQSMKVPRGQALLPNAERAVSTGEGRSGVRRGFRRGVRES
eukprot:1177247-Prorocentrum_minimum.AAC.7